MNNVPSINPYHEYLVNRGFFKKDSIDWYTGVEGDKSNIANQVIVPHYLWDSFVRTVGFNNARDLLNTVIGEFNALQNHWSLINYYRAMTSGLYGQNDVVDMFGDLENGHRKNAAVSYLQRAHAASNGMPVDVIQTLGGFASLLNVAGTFLSQLIESLSQFNNGYYSSLCEISLSTMTPEFLTITASKRISEVPFMPVRPLEMELGLICGGNYRLLKQIKLNTGAPATLPSETPLAPAVSPVRFIPIQTPQPDEQQVPDILDGGVALASSYLSKFTLKEAG